MKRMSEGNQAEAAVMAAASPAGRARQYAMRGQELFEAGRVWDSLDCWRQAAAVYPHPVYHFNAGIVAWQLRMLDLAGEHLQEAVRLGPRYAAAREALSQWYLEEARPDLALEHSTAAISLAPHDSGVALSHAFALAAAGQTEQAWQILEPQVTAPAIPGRAAVLYGKMARRLGKEQHAVEIIQRVLTTQAALPERSHLLFLAAKTLDRMERYDDAFAHARAAHESAPRSYDPQYNAVWTDRRIEFYTRSRLQSLARSRHGSRRPVFIVGMPRSGTSLVEQILVSHPRVFGAGEMNDLDRIGCGTQQAEWSGGKPYPHCLEGLSSAAADQLAGEYLSRLRAINDIAIFVTDKTPLNFRWLGLVQLLFPECRVIHCVRDPLDTCLSCYMTDFNVGNDFAQDLTHLGLFYRDYSRLMEHWRQVLDLPILEVRYEDVVADLQPQIRRMLDFLGLPWDERCLKFHENERHVATASREQVRLPIYASSIGRWRYYQKHLQPLIDAIGRRAET